MFMKSYRQITTFLSSVFTLCMPKTPQLALFSLSSKQFLQNYKCCNTIIEVNIGFHINTRNRKMPLSWHSQALSTHTCPCTSNNLKKKVSKFDGKINLTPECVTFVHCSCRAEETDTSSCSVSCYSSFSCPPRMAIPGSPEEPQGQQVPIQSPPAPSRAQPGGAQGGGKLLELLGCGWQDTIPRENTFALSSHQTSWYSRYSSILLHWVFQTATFLSRELKPQSQQLILPIPTSNTTKLQTTFKCHSHLCSPNKSKIMQKKGLSLSFDTCKRS